MRVDRFSKVTLVVQNGGRKDCPLEPLLLAINKKRRGYRLRMLAKDGLALESEAIRYGLPVSAVLPRLAEIGAEGLRAAVAASATSKGGRVSLRFVNVESNGALHLDLAVLPTHLRADRLRLLGHYGALKFYALSALGGYPLVLSTKLFGEAMSSASHANDPVAQVVPLNTASPALSEPTITAVSIDPAPQAAAAAPAIAVPQSSAGRADAVQSPSSFDDFDDVITLDSIREAIALAQKEGRPG